MTSPQPPRLDLSKLPEPIRSKLKAQLERLPPEMRKELLEKGSPILERAIARARQAPASLPRHGDGRYNATVQPGDRLLVSLTMIAMLVAAAGALYFLHGAP